MTTDPHKLAASLTLIALAERIEALPHYDRSLNCQIQEIVGDQFGQGYVSSIDGAKRVVPDDYLWCTGIALDEDKGEIYGWANIHAKDSNERLDISTRAATPELALVSAGLRVRAVLIEEVVR